MAQFTFRLQPLMKLREAQRDRRREELAEAYRAEQLLSDRQAAITQEIDQNIELTRRNSQPGTVNIDGLLQTNRYELLLNAQLRQLASQREKIGAEIQRRRDALVEADQELRILEKLRERHEAEFWAKQEKAEARELDEIAIRRQNAHGGKRG